MRALSIAAALVAAACGASEPAPPPPLLDAADRDHDGHRRTDAGGGDCADDDATVSPDASEVCNGKDDDCDGAIDEGFECVAGIDAPCGDGLVRRCSSSCALGACERLDDCRAGTPECEPGATEPCDGGCPGASRVCTPGCTWGACEPPLELCNGIDDDCDGDVDEGLWGPVTGLHEVGTSSSPVTFVSLATVDSGVALAYDVEPGSFEVAWVDGDGHVLREPSTRPDREHLLPYAVGIAELAVFTAVIGGQVRVVVESLDGTRGEWTGGIEAFTALVSTGTEILLLEREFLHAIDLDGNELRDPVTMPYEEHGDAIWTEEGLVLAVAGGLSWIGTDGKERLRLELEGDTTPQLGTRGPDLLALTTAVGGWTARVLDARGGERWVARATIPKDLELRLFPTRVHAVADGWVVLAPSLVGLGGWWLEEAGTTATTPEWWSRRGSGKTTAGIGSTLWLATSDRLVARIGCREDSR